jgi:hypothetical protein
VGKIKRKFQQYPCHGDIKIDLDKYFAGFLTYGKRKFVESLKFIGAQLWKLLIFQLYCCVYTVQFGIHEKKARGCSKVIVDFIKKICFLTFKSYILKQFF